MANNILHCDKIPSKTSQSAVQQRRYDDSSAVLGPAAGVFARSISSSSSSSPYDVYYSHLMSDTGDQSPSHKFAVGIGLSADPPAQTVLHQLQEQVKSQRSQLCQLRRQEVLGAPPPASSAEFDDQGLLGTLSGGCSPVMYPRGDDDAHARRRYSIGQTLPQRLPSPQTTGAAAGQRHHRRAESESTPSSLAARKGGGDAGTPGHNCVLKQLDALVQYQQQQLFEVQQKQPLDLALLEKIYWEQKKIAMELETEINAHQSIADFASLPAAAGQDSRGDSKASEADLIRRKFDEMNRRWHRTEYKTHKASRTCSSESADQCVQLLRTLCELNDWLTKLDAEIRVLQPPGGDLGSLKLQEDDLQAVCFQLDEQRCHLEMLLEAGSAFFSEDGADTKYLNADDLDIIHVNSNSELENKQIAAKIRRLTVLLPRKWSELEQKARESQTILYDIALKMQIFQDSLERLSQKFSEVPDTAAKSQTDGVKVEDLQQELNQTKSFQQWLMSMKVRLDNCNEMANEFQNSSIILSHRNVSKLEILNSRWRTLLSNTENRTKQLKDALRESSISSQFPHSASVKPPWVKALTENKVPYYINHSTETTHWDHPEMTRLMQNLAELDRVRFSAYRTAMKLQMLRKRLHLDLLEAEKVSEVFDLQLQESHDATISVSDIVSVVENLFRHLSEANSEIDFILTSDLVINWLLNVYDNQRSGRMQVLSFRVSMVLLCNAQLEQKYQHLFGLVAGSKGTMDQSQLGLLLRECLQIPRQLGEIASFGGNNVEPSVKSCFEKVEGRLDIEASHFLDWMKLEPQSMVWLPVMHRMTAAETAMHQARCSVCKESPIIGFRYRCLKCFSYDMCQNCFFCGKKAKGHKLTHPMQEYCTAATSGEDMRDFTKMFKNKFRSKHYFKKHPRLGYLPVQSTDRDSSQSPQSSSSFNASNTEMHSRLEMYASKLAEVESKSLPMTPDSGSDDEHSLIAHFCHSLHGTEPGHSLQSPMQIIMAMDSSQRTELEEMIFDLENENRILQEEYDQLKQMHYETTANPFDSLRNGGGFRDGDPANQDVEMIAEARLLRQHKGRLEARMHLLEEHNKQLESQLQRLRHMLEQPDMDTHIITYPTSFGASPPVGGSSALNDMTTRCPPPSFQSFSAGQYSNGHFDGRDHNLSDHELRMESGRNISRISGIKGSTGSTMENLFQVAEEVGKAVGSLVNIMTDDEDDQFEEEKRIKNQKR